MDKREIILGHNSNPINKNIPESNDYIKVNTNNENCVDNFNIYILFDNDNIKDICFEGEGCAISTSSTSIMIKNLIGKTTTEALNYIDNFENMLEGNPFDKELLQEAIVYEDINKQQNRVICASLPYRGIKEILKTRK